MRTPLLLAALGALTACNATKPREAGEPERKTEMTTKTYGDDLAFLAEHQEVIELAGADGKARVALVPGYQGRVMTSTSGGKGGPSYGWLNREAIASNERKPHMNVFGGEDRIWLGPEGGQFSIFFHKGDPFDLDHWQTPAPLDWGSWEKVEADSTHARFRKEISVVNYSGTPFSLEADRTIRLLSTADASERLGVDLPGDTEVVAYESVNAIKNTGDSAWSKETGLLSIWILGQYNPSPETTIVIPFVAGPEADLGPIVNDAYFGKVPSERLVVKDGVLYFRGDGNYRSKNRYPSKACASRHGELRRRERPDARAVRASRGCDRLREQHVGDSGRAVPRRRREQLQRRSAVARRETARSLLRARIVVSGRGARPRRDPDSRPPNIPHSRSGGEPGQNRPSDPRRLDRRRPERLRVIRWNPFATVEIGRSALPVTRLGLGGAPLGGLFESVKDEDARATVASAYGAGVRYFDTAPFYGHGTGEIRLGKCLKPYPRASFVLSTKVGRVLVPVDPGAVEDHQYRDVLPLNPVFDFSRDGVLRSFESSLDRLGLERIDILHIHDPDEHYREALDQAFPALARLRAEGRISAVGAGMNQWEMLLDFARAADFDCFLLAGRYTLLDQSSLGELLPECERRGIAVLLGGPYNSGILAAGSRGAGHYNYQAPPPGIMERLVSLERVAERHGVPLKAAALQFPLGHPAVASVIPGARTAAEVEENVRMMSHRIPPAFWQDLREESLVAPEAPLPSD